MKKLRSHRKTVLSKRWANLAFKTANIGAPTKDQLKQLRLLWEAGYSHKDAANALIGGAE